MAVQLILIVVTAIGVAVALPLWGISDENAHVSYVARDPAGHLPLLGQFCIQPRHRAGSSPSRVRIGQPVLRGLQPLLYYAVMAIPWDVAKAVGGTRAAVVVCGSVDAVWLMRRYRAVVGAARGGWRRPVTWRWWRSHSR